MAVTEAATEEDVTAEEHEAAVTEAADATEDAAEDEHEAATEAQDRRARHGRGSQGASRNAPLKSRSPFVSI